MKNTAAIALLLARTSAQDVSRDRAFNPPKMIADAEMTTCTDDKTKLATTNKTTADSALTAAQKELTTAEALVTSETAKQVTAVKAVAAEDLKSKKVLDDDRAAVLEALRLRIAMNDATRAKAASLAAKNKAATALQNAQTAASDATTLKTAADKAVVQAFNHVNYEKAQLGLAITAVTNTQLAYTANHGSTVAVDVLDPAGAKGTEKILLNMPDAVTGTAPAHVVPMGTGNDADKVKMVTANIKAPASPIAGTKGDLATKTTAQTDTKAAMTTAETAAKAAYDIKETLLTAYCVQSTAWGVALADLKGGAEPSASYTMGHGGRITDANNAAIDYYKANANPPKYDFQMGGGVQAAPGAAPQLGILTAGTNDPVYRCTIPLHDAQGAVNNAPALATGVTVLKPGDNTINSARLIDCAADPALKTTQAACEAKSTHCKFASNACSEDATKTVLLNKPAFAKAIADALALADPQCLQKKLKADSTDELVYGTEADCIKNLKCKWASNACAYKDVQAGTSISAVYTTWRTASNASMDAFKDMIADADSVYTVKQNSSADKPCKASISGIVETAVDTISGYGDIIQVDGAKIPVWSSWSSTVTKAKCRKACSAFPAVKYYTAAVCTVATECCAGFSQTGTTCKFQSGASIANLIADTTGTGTCYLRNVTLNSGSHKSKVWNTAAIASINDSQASEWTGNVITTSKYGLYLIKFKLYTDKRDIMHTKAQDYYMGKRLNTLMATAYKTSYDVYHARFAQYAGTKADFQSNTDKSKKGLYDAAVTAYNDAVTANDTKKKAYDAALADFKANRSELMNQMLILKAAVADATTAKTAETAAKATLGAAKAGNVAATGEYLKKENADTDYTTKDGESTKATKAHTDYTKAGATLLTAQGAATTAKADIKKLRDAANTAAGKTKEAATAAGLKRATVVLKVADVAAKQVLLDKAIQTCKETKWDAYKATLAKAESDREKDITTITTLLKANKAAKPAVDKGAGAKGARCEKALTQGASGPKRSAATCQTPETNCCGAAKKLDAVTGLLMTVEVCWPKAEKKYKYQPPRGPMKTTMPATQDDWDFACIEGAQKLVAATAALATAAYMMA